MKVTLLDAVRDFSRVAGRKYLRAYRNTTATMKLPEVDRVRTIPGSVWGIVLVKNEIDIMPGTMQHFIDQGLSGIIVCDNGSTDGTREYLLELAERNPIVHVITHDSPAFHQGQETTKLAHLAWRMGADWIIPFDADEHWMAGDGLTLPQFLGECDADMVRAALHNVFPLVDADGNVVLERFDEQVHRDPKVAFRASRAAIVLVGNHKIIRTGKITDGLYVAHFPWRSQNQVTAKVHVGAAGLKAAGVDRGVGTHWQNLEERGDQGLRQLWDDLIAGKKADVLGWSPHGPFRKVDALSWTTWDPGNVLEASPVI